MRKIISVLFVVGSAFLLCGWSWGKGSKIESKVYRHFEGKIKCKCCRETKTAEAERKYQQELQTYRSDSYWERWRVHEQKAPNNFNKEWMAYLGKKPELPEKDRVYDTYHSIDKVSAKSGKVDKVWNVTIHFTCPNGGKLTEQYECAEEYGSIKFYNN